MKCVVLILIILPWLGVSQVANANPCGDYIYNKHGKLRKYEYLNLTLTENTAKHGTSTSSAVSTEGSTASVDYGVSTGATGSYKQSTSTEGECKWGGLFASREEFRNYIAQNINEIKREMSVGKGGHLEILAQIYGCSDPGALAFSKICQKHFGEFFTLEASQSEKFVDTLENMIMTEMPQQCVGADPQSVG